MILFWIIYLLGMIATILLLYYGLEHGEKVTVGDIMLSLMICGCSWLAFISVLIIFFADRVVFIKK